MNLFKVLDFLFKGLKVFVLKVRFILYFLVNFIFCLVLVNIIVIFWVFLGGRILMFFLECKS